MLRKPIILAVDDIPSNLLALEAVLEKDFDLRFAHSGQEAIAMLKQAHDVDAILMDLQMPIMDGFEAAAGIKKLPGCEDIPIVFITAVYSEDPFIKRGYAAGGVDYFTKPFDPDLLRLKMGIYASFRQRAAVLKERERQIKETEEILQAGRKFLAFLGNLPVDGRGHDACAIGAERRRHDRLIVIEDPGGHAAQDEGLPEAIGVPYAARTRGPA